MNNYKVPFEEKDAKTQFYARICFCLFFLVVCLYQASQTKQVQVLPLTGEYSCMKDYTFVWTEAPNQWLWDNQDIKNDYIIYASFLMDCMILSFCVIQLIYWGSARVFFAYSLFFGLRTLIQNTFFMSRPRHFMWSFPGLYSITVPYPDINDFWFSGHVGTCTMLVLEFRSMKWYKMSYWCCFVLVNQWILMMLVRTHYVIDMICGLFFGHWFFMHAEWISYYIDVKALGITSIARRG